MEERDKSLGDDNLSGLNDRQPSGDAMISSTSDHSDKSMSDSCYGQHDNDDKSELEKTTVTDIIGNFGLYQLSLVIITFIRYICVSMMTNTGPLIAPDIDYYCRLPESLANLTRDNIYVQGQLKNACQIKLPTNIIYNRDLPAIHDSTYICLHWDYNTSLVGRTMTDEFNLVCNRDLLRSLFQSSISVGVVLASVFWGTFSDKHGRCFSMRICFLVSLISGSISVVAPNFMIYVLSRSVCSLGDLGLVVSLATMLVESVGNRYRAAACIIVYLGWAIGVMIMPWITDYFKDFRMLMLFTVVCHLITLPWLLLKKESVRWLLINKNFSEAQREVKRISFWNGHRSRMAQQNIDIKFAQLKCRFDVDDNDDNDLELGADLRNLHTSRASVDLDSGSVIAGLESSGDNLDNSYSSKQRIPQQLYEGTKNVKIASNSTGNNRKFGRVKARNNDDSHCSSNNKIDNNSLFGGFDKLRQLFESKELSIATLTLVWISFNSELLYMSFILINSDIGDDLYLNYAMGGLMETLAALISCIMISNITRRLSLASSLLCISLLCFILAFVYQTTSLVVWLLSPAKLAISTLSSLLYVTATEMFPTDLRQTGSGVCATLGSMGAVVAPFFCSQLSNLIGWKYVLILFSISSTSAAVLIPFFLRETKGVELADTLDEIEQAEKR